MIVNHEKKDIAIKIVYYGPAMSGKTTSLKYIFRHYGVKEEKITSIESTIGRTLFFDFGALEFIIPKEYSLRILLYSATGQDFYASTRPATLNGVDGIIFVADSQIKYFEHNKKSWNELKTLFKEEFSTIPIVISLNKDDIDIDRKLKEEDLRRSIDHDEFRHISIKHTIALSGVGVFESLDELIGIILPDFSLENLQIKN